MGRLFKALVFLLIVAGVALFVFAFLGDLSPTRETITAPVSLDVN